MGSALLCIMMPGVRDLLYKHIVETTIACFVWASLNLISLTIVVLDLLYDTYKFYSYGLSNISTEVVQVAKIIHPLYHELDDSTLSIPWLWMSWRCEEPGHQQLCYWPSCSGIFHYHHQVDWRNVIHWWVKKMMSLVMKEISFYKGSLSLHNVFFS